MNISSNNNMTNLWMTKYRPQTLDEIVIPDDIKDNVKQWIKSKTIPHLILIGPPGVGKTSLATVITNELNAEKLEFNASEERGIDTIRDKVMTFAMASSNRPKIVFMDEADSLTADAQDSLRNPMDKYSSSTRFIFTGNYDKFSDPIKDRCVVIKFKKLNKSDVFSIVSSVLNRETVTYNEDDVKKIIDIKYPSMRKIFNAIQLYTNEEEKRLEIPLSIFNDSEDKIVEEIFAIFHQGDIRKMRQLIIDSDLDDFIILYKYWFDNIDDVYQQVTIGEYLYRNGYVSDKEINFTSMCIALKNNIYPFILKNNIKCEDNVNTNIVTHQKNNTIINNDVTSIKSKYVEKRDVKKLETACSNALYSDEIDDCHEDVLEYLSRGSIGGNKVIYYEESQLNKKSNDNADLYE